jgi:hypothetical protein
MFRSRVKVGTGAKILARSWLIIQHPVIQQFTLTPSRPERKCRASRWDAVPRNGGSFFADPIRIFEEMRAARFLH